MIEKLIYYFVPLYSLALIMAIAENGLTLDIISLCIADIIFWWVWYEVAKRKS